MKIEGYQHEKRENMEKKEKTENKKDECKASIEDVKSKQK